MRNTASSDDIQSGISDSDKSVKTPLGKKILATFGILFIAIGVFLAAFGLSYRLIMLPKTTTVPKDNAEAEIIRLNTQINQLETENRKLCEDRSKDSTDASGKHGESTLEGNLGSIALPFRGTRTRTVSGVVRKSVWIATHHHKRNQNGNHQDGTGDDDKNFSIHEMSP